MIRNFYVLACLATCLLGACGEKGKVVYKTELDGFEKDQLRVKLEETLEEITLEDGSEGYLLTTHIRFSEGGSKRMANFGKTWMKRNFEFVRSESETKKGGEVESKQEIYREGSAMVIVDHKGGKDKTEKIPLEGKQTLYGELHPLLYAKELTRTGMSKAYWTFYEPMRLEAPTKVRAAEKVNVKSGEDLIPCLRYMIRSMSSPKEFNEFFISTVDFSVVKIKVGPIEFRKPGTK